MTVRAAALSLMLAVCAGSCSKAPQEAVAPSSVGSRSDAMTTSKTGGSGPPSKARPQASADAVVAPARPRSTRTFPETAPGSDRLPRITARADLAAHDGSEVRVVGTYVERDVRMRPTPPPAYQGHVAIALADGPRSR